LAIISLPVPSDRALADDREAIAVKADQRVVGVGEQDHVLHAEFG
jgi:hypothetical protein